MIDGAIVVDLSGVHPNEAYTWGVEAGSFMNFSREDLLKRHIVHAGNIGMIEVICLGHGMQVDIVSSNGPFLIIDVTKGESK